MSHPGRVPLPTPPGHGHGQAHLHGHPKQEIQTGYKYNPKSILTDRTQQSQHSHTVPLETGSLRVTFAKINSPKHESFASSLLSFHHAQNMDRPGTAASGAGTPLTKQEEIIKKIQFPKVVDCSRPGSPVAGTTVGNNDRVKKAYAKGKLRAGTVDVLYPENKPKLTSGSSIGFVPGMGKKSEDSVGKMSKGSEKAGGASLKTKTRSKKLVRKATNKSVASSVTRRKSGKKIKKKKKSKFEDELEKELVKPAQLNEEYAQELNKITQILKAVSAFDEATSTANSTVNNIAGRDNDTSFFTYSGLTTTKPAPAAGTKPAPKRPLSGDELKQLLSSITRVVSLHQLPVAPKPGTATNTMTNKKDPLSTDTPLLDTTPSTSTKSKKRKVRKTKKVVPKYPTFIKGSQSDPAHNQKGQRGNMNTKNVLAANSMKTKSKASIGRPKPKTTATKKPASSVNRPNSDGGSSVSSLEKDPVKHAAFLRKYFEESIRLANKKSSEDLLALGAEAAVVTPGVPPIPNSSTTESEKKRLKPKKSLVRKT